MDEFLLELSEIGIVAWSGAPGRREFAGGSTGKREVTACQRTFYRERLPRVN